MSSTANWLEDSFFESSPRASVDGGTTSSGSLWHSISPRWGHSMHTMCSYQGMFPAKVAHYFIQRYSKPGELVVDPFSGRGTTALQARVEGRRGIANDLSPLAYVLSAAKVAPPSWETIQQFVNELEKQYRKSQMAYMDITDDIKMLFHDNTLRQMQFIRQRLLSEDITTWTADVLMVAGALAGIMHGAWRRDGTSQYLSISMPNTFSMSPTYVKKYIHENGLQKLDQDVFACLRDKLARLYLDANPGSEGTAHHLDAASLLTGPAMRPGSADLIVTSPPYLQVVNYGTANWIRLWLLGLDGVGRDQGAGRKKLDADLDHRHTFTSYKSFMLKTLQGVQRALKPDGVAVLIIGDVADPGKGARPLASQLWNEIAADTTLRLIDMVEDDLPSHNKVSRIWGETKGQATNRDCALVLTHKAAGAFYDNQEIDWDEPYKDGGPDAAHDRLRRVKIASHGSA